MSVARAVRRLNKAKTMASKSSTAFTLNPMHSLPIPAFSASKTTQMAPVFKSMHSTPKHVKGDLATVAIGIAAGLAVLGVGKMWMDASASSDMSKENLVNYFLELAHNIEHLVEQLPQLADQVIQHATSTGQQISEEQVHQVLIERLGQAVQMADQELSKKYRFSQEGIEKAMALYQQDADVIAAIQHLESVIQNSPLAQVNVTIPEDLTPERALEVMARVLNAIGRAIEEAINEAKAQGMKDVNAEKEKWQEAYLRKTQQYTEEIHREVGIDDQVMNAAINQFAQDPAFGMKLQQLLQEQQAKFQALGISLQDVVYLRKCQEYSQEVHHKCGFSEKTMQAAITLYSIDPVFHNQFFKALMEFQSKVSALGITVEDMLATIAKLHLPHPSCTKTPLHVKGDLATVVVGVAAGLFALGLGKSLTNSSTPPNIITKDNVVEYLNDEGDYIANLMVNLPILMDKVWTEAKQDSGTQPFKSLVKHFNQAIIMAHEDLLNEYGVSQDDMDKAIDWYKQDMEVKAAMEYYESMVKNSLLSQGDLTIPEDFTSEKALELMNKAFIITYHAAKDAINEAKAQGMKDPNAELEKWQQTFRHKLDDAYSQEIYPKYGIPREIMTVIIVLFGFDLTFNVKCLLLTAKLQYKIESLGARFEDVRWDY
ncbi:hypothetical protein THRCLA_03839 [Thraustotheca clavata]|uniref:Uncharacterized protein n=1 Tax=Thraustotheca clavata TaxID=74557 RepID=A0A1W0A105_9STRA|nr:hypothetical protein THRCLA_03839 [Thraustotheca clavata]